MTFSVLRLKTNKPIAVRGLEFLGPICGDSTYEIDFGTSTNTATPSAWRGVKTIFAKEKKNFYLELDPPVVVGVTNWEYFHYKIQVELLNNYTIETLK